MNEKKFIGEITVSEAYLLFLERKAKQLDNILSYIHYVMNRPEEEDED